ncbi:MAG: A-macroglobulin complement component [Planctomycetota bacterium]|nr:A-macroglobulin complement component [Planctomycetota bacterium]
MARTGFKRTILPAVVFLAPMLFRPAAAFAAEPGPPTPERLGGEGRKLAFLSTDKPIYRPGETAYFRAVFLMADSYFPVREGGEAAGLIITGPRDAEAARLAAPIRDSVAGFSWTIPAGTAGGSYEAKAESGGGPPAVRRFEIRAYAPPRLKTRIEFLREGYGPGDTVTAAAHVERAEGGFPAGARVTAVARVDGAETARLENIGVDENGDCRAVFTLPEAIDRGEGSLVFLIEDGGVIESAGKTIPILLQTLDIDFYPEGGELVAGLPSRLYLQARRPDGKPADLEGDLVRLGEGDAVLPGEPLSEIRTVHEGRGRAEFTPRPGERYGLRPRRPSGISRLFPLPAVRPEGVVLQSERDAYAFGEPIAFRVEATPAAGASRITLCHREKPLARAELAPGANRVELDAGEAEGALIATVWNADGLPLAERLVFRRPKFAVRLGIGVETEPAGASPSPGGKVRIRVTATDESGRPAEAVVGLSVVDDSLLSMLEKRDLPPSLPTMVYLENEVRDLADAEVYFDPANPDAARDIDLLLGTQGWRRFVLARLDEALAENRDPVRRVLAIREPMPVFAMRAGGLRRFAPNAEAAMDNFMPVDAAAIEEIQGELDGVHAAAEPPAPALAPVPPLPPAAAMVAADRWAGAREIAKPMPAPLAVVREYAHAVRPNRRPNDRVDFAETLYWNAGVRTNPRNGEAVVSFDLSDSVTVFRIRADAFANNGALGEGTAELASLEPFHIEAKVPEIMIQGDRPIIPIALVNNTGGIIDRPGLEIRSDGLEVEKPALPAALSEGGRERALAGLAAPRPGDFALTLAAAGGGHADTVTRKIAVLPRGFPIELDHSGLVGPGTPFSRRIVVPPDVVPGSLSVSAKLYPAPLANLEEALNALLRRPSGCFEQTSSTSYPLVMAQRYFTTHAGASPERIRRAGELLEESYRHLLSFESPEKGYEWFGGDPGHEALTAYGLMQFDEMSRVTPVDSAMLTRTRDWLLSRRDGRGGFLRNEKALDSFGAAPAPLTNLYILWTLLETGEKPESLEKELAAARKTVAETNDPYLLALGVNILRLANGIPAARAAADRLRQAQAKDGGVPGAETSITRSGGESLDMETTSLAVLGWLRLGGDYAGAVEPAMAWLFGKCKAGRFGSTQATILALKAINAYDAARPRLKAPGTARLIVDGKPFGRPVAFDEKSLEALELPDFSAALSPGEHRIGLEMEGGGELPFALHLEMNVPRPPDSPDCRLTLSTSLSAREIGEGEPLDLRASIRAEGEDVTMPVAILGIPAGLEPRIERLKELAAAGAFAAWETRGRELVLYWRLLKAGESIDLILPLTAAIPGGYGAPASRAYAFYTDERKRWAAGESVTIVPAKR